MLQITDDKAPSIQAIKNKKNQEVLNGTSGTDSGDVGGDINLSFVIKLAKSKKSNLAKTNSSRPDFLIPEAKKAFIYVQKAFIKTLILRHFDSESYIWIKTNALGYIIDGILSQITSDQPSSDHVAHKIMLILLSSKLANGTH